MTVLLDEGVLGGRGPLPAVSAERPVDLYKPLFERSGICMANLDPQLRVRDANSDFFREFGRQSSSVRGRLFQDFLHPSVEPRLRQQLGCLLDGRRASFGERMLGTRPDGTVFSGELTGIAATKADGTVGAVMVLVKAERDERAARPRVDPGKMLSDIDARILEGVAAGTSTVQMASRLYLSRQGVEYHVSTMFRKLKVTNRPALVSKAYALGILSTGCWPPKVVPEYEK
ncbi:helix-turn-helix transcriptional regulator [Allokutzneria multivorans]